MLRGLVLAALLTACSAAPTTETAAPTEAADPRADCAAQGGRWLPASSSCIGGEDEEESEATSEPTTRPTARARTTARPTAEPPEQEELALVEQGFTFFPGDTAYVQYAVVFENPNPDTYVAERTNVNITWYDAAGGVAGSTSDYLTLGLPGQKVALAGVAFDVSEPAEMEVQYRVGTWTEVDFAPGGFTFQNVTTEPQQYGGPVTKGLIISSFQEDQEYVRIAAVYKNATGDVLGGDSGLAEFVPAGGQIGFEISPLGAFSGIAKTEVYASP